MIQKKSNGIFLSCVFFKWILSITFKFLSKKKKTMGIKIVSIEIAMILAFAIGAGENLGVM